MHGKKLALGPYLERIEDACRPLSKDNLTAVILSMAKEVEAGRRREFLNNLLSMLPVGASTAAASVFSSETDLLDDIKALKKSILERVDSIEDGSYWDEPHQNDWDEDFYNDEDPDALSEDHQAALAGFFHAADRFFLNGKAGEARTVYGALLDLVEEVSEKSYLPNFDVDLREARARYCRCVYDFAEDSDRVKQMAAAMAVDRPENDFASVLSREYPLLRDVIDAQTGDLAGFADFLPAWEKVLASKGFTKDRLAELRLEAASFHGDLSKISKLARSWQAKQPRGYLFWLKQLEMRSDWPRLKEVAHEALAIFKPGDAKEQVAEYLATSGQNLGDDGLVLEGRRERLKANICDENLMDLLNEAGRQGKRGEELAAICVLLKRTTKHSGEDKLLLAKALLMAGEMAQTVLLTKGEKAVGWSCGSAAGLLFGSILFLVSGKRAECSLIRDLLDNYANMTSIPSCRFRIITEDSGPSCSEEIRQGLNLVDAATPDLARYFKWARKMGEERINHIVSSKYRSAYDRAAAVLGAMAEALEASGEPQKAEEILQEYYYKRFNRFPAFRREVRDAVGSSEILKKYGSIF